jgi:hypothetical protein
MLAFFEQLEREYETEPDLPTFDTPLRVPADTLLASVGGANGTNKMYDVNDEHGRWLWSLSDEEIKRQIETKENALDCREKFRAVRESYLGPEEIERSHEFEENFFQRPLRVLRNLKWHLAMASLGMCS